jgi:hypothetical protein
VLKVNLKYVTGIESEWLLKKFQKCPPKKYAKYYRDRRAKLGEEGEASGKSRRPAKTPAERNVSGVPGRRRSGRPQS